MRRPLMGTLAQSIGIIRFSFVGELDNDYFGVI
jgi:hypothetical protein